MPYLAHISLLAASLALVTWSSTVSAVDLRFYGDVYLPEHVLTHTETTAQRPRLFAATRHLVDEALHNIVNLEGTVTAAVVPYEPKRFLLKMPYEVPGILKRAGFNVATLANNHSMDFGYPGLFDTLLELDAAGIEHTGAGANLAAAMRPLLLTGEEQTYCLLAISRTLPQSFWAQDDRPGTAAAVTSKLTEALASCTAAGFAPIVSIHWGKENSRRSLRYQQVIAHHAIDHGARLVIGHHPHVVQEIEIYRGQPIIYSLGNFAFGTAPLNSQADGLAVGLKIEKQGRILALVLTPLVVNNDVVDFRPRPLEAGEKDPLAEHMPASHPCAFDAKARHWLCVFDDRES